MVLQTNTGGGVVKERSRIFRDAIFIVTEERRCPIYNVGEEFKVENFCLTVPSLKPDCLILAEEIIKIVTSRESFRDDNMSMFSSKKVRFNCGGCEGLIHFEFKKEKSHVTLHMKLLQQAEERQRRQRFDKFFRIFRNLGIFESLDDDALSDLTVLLEVKTIPPAKVIIKKGDPGSHLYIIMNGLVSVQAEDGSKIAETETGGIFGEMSLLTGDPVTNSIYTITATQVAMLSIKNFKHALKKHPVLQLFLLRMLVDRAQTATLRSGNITSGMTGELAEIPAVDLFQLINSSQKTGRIDLIMDMGKATVCFKDGQIIHANFLKLRDKEAIFALLSVKNGHFSYTRGVPGEFENLSSIGDFMGLLMEGLQRIDEDQEE